MGFLLALLFFLSGITGLVYQVLWSRYLELVLGSTGSAHAIVLAVFLGGLAIGNAWLGRYADRISKPLKFYGWLEIAIAGFAVITPLLLSLGTSAYLMIASSSWHPALLFCLRVFFAAVVLLIPTICMGGTLPAMTRHFTRRISQLESRLAWLYFLNSAGAAAGASLAGFFLIPALGLDLTLTITAVANLVIGIIAIFSARYTQEVQEESTPDLADRQQAEQDDSLPFQLESWHVRLVLVVIFLSGWISLSYEIAWIRLLALVLGSSTYSFSAMLTAFISGIALGSLAVQLRRGKGAHPLLLLGIAEIGVALSVLLLLPMYERLPYYFFLLRGMLAPTESAYSLYLVLKFVFCFVMVLPPTIFLGATLPLAAAVVTRSASEIGASVGRVYSLNTLGNVLGAITAGLLLMPLLGVQYLIITGAIINLALGLAIFIAAVRRPAIRVPVAALVGCLGMLACVFGSRPWDTRIISSGPFLKRPGKEIPTFAQYRRAFDRQKILYHRDDISTTVTVGGYSSGSISLRVNGKTDASNGADMATQMLSGHIPMLLRPDSKKVMVIGLGSGITASSVLRHPVETLDVVEISRAVPEAAKFFAPYHRGALDDSRLAIHIDDARSFLQLSREKFDAVISEPSNPWIAGVGNLFTREFYDIVKTKLNDQGMMIQWVHTYSMNNDLVQTVVRTFSSAFENVVVFHTLTTAENHGDFILIGSKRPIPLDARAMQERIQFTEVQADLNQLRLSSPASVLALQVLSHDQLQKLRGRGALNRDRFPVLEYEAPRHLFSAVRSDIFGKADRRFRDESGGYSPYLQQFLKHSKRSKLHAEELFELSKFFEKYGDQEIFTRVAKYWLATYPNDPRGHFVMSQLYRSDKRYMRALLHLDRVLQLTEESSYARIATDVALELILNHPQMIDDREAYFKRLNGYISLEYKRSNDRLSYLIKQARVKELQQDIDGAIKLIEEVVGLAEKQFGSDSKQARTFREKLSQLRAGITLPVMN